VKDFPKACAKKPDRHCTSDLKLMEENAKMWLNDNKEQKGSAHGAVIFIGHGRYQRECIENNAAWRQL
jgi:hypothetical protein